MVHHILGEVGLSGKEKVKKSNHSRPHLSYPQVVVLPDALNDDGWVGGANKARIRHLLEARVYRMSSLQRFLRPLFVLGVEEEEEEEGAFSHHVTLLPPPPTPGGE